MRSEERGGCNVGRGRNWHVGNNRTVMMEGLCCTLTMYVMTYRLGDRIAAPERTLGIIDWTRMRDMEGYVLSHSETQHSTPSCKLELRRRARATRRRAAEVLYRRYVGIVGGRREHKQGGGGAKVEGGRSSY